MPNPNAIRDFWFNLSNAAAKYKIADYLGPISLALILIDANIYALNKVLPHDAPAQSMVKQGTNRTMTLCADLVNFLHTGDFDHNKYQSLSPVDENSSLESLKINIDRTMKLDTGFEDILISIENQLEKLRMAFEMLWTAKDGSAELARIDELAQEVSTPWEIFSTQTNQPPISCPEPREIFEKHNLSYGWHLTTNKASVKVEGGFDSLLPPARNTVNRFHSMLCERLGKPLKLIGAMGDETGRSLTFWTARLVPAYNVISPRKQSFSPKPLVLFEGGLSRGRQVLDMVKGVKPAEQLKKSGSVEDFVMVPLFAAGNGGAGK